MKRVIISTLLMLASLPVLADITASYKIREGGTMQISYRDDQHVRMDVPGGGYALLSGDKMYMVNKEAGQWVATDMDQMKGMMANMPFSGGARDKEKSERDFSFVDTGKKETVAGYTGKLFEITDKTNGKTYQAVLSDHDDIVALYRGLLRVSQKIVNSMGMGKGMPDLPASRGGLLRKDQDILLTSLDKSDKGSSYYKLPAGVKIRDMSEAMQGMKNMPMPSADDMKNMDPRARAMMEQMMQKMQQ